MLLANAGLPHEKACEETCYMSGFASRTSHVVFLHKAEEMASGSEFAGLHRVPHHMHGVAPSSDDQDGCVSEIPHDGSGAGELSSHAHHCTANSRFRTHSLLLVFAVVGSYLNHLSATATISPKLLLSLSSSDIFFTSIAASKRLHLGLASANSLKRKCLRATAPRECGQKQAPTHVGPYIPGLRPHSARL